MRQGIVVECEIAQCATALESRVRPGAIDENLSHGKRRERHEVRAIAPWRVGSVGEFEIRLVHQRGCAQ